MFFIICNEVFHQELLTSGTSATNSKFCLVSSLRSIFFIMEENQKRILVTTGIFIETTVSVKINLFFNLVKNNRSDIIFLPFT